jgi:hypothetical protein
VAFAAPGQSQEGVPGFVAKPVPNKELKLTPGSVAWGARAGPGGCRAQLNSYCVGLYWFPKAYSKVKLQRGEAGCMRLVLMRHGESEHELRGIIAGASGCRGLTE